MCILPFWLKDFHLCVYIFCFCQLRQEFALGHICNASVTFMSLGISAKPAIMHNCAFTIFNRPEWVVDAIWSNGSIEVCFFPSVAADIALRLGPNIGISE